MIGYSRTILLLILFFAVWQSSYAQSSKENRLGEDDLKGMLREVASATTDDQKITLNQLFIDRFQELLQQEKTYDFPFDSLKAIGKLSAPDEKFRLFTWSFRLSNGRYKFFGIIQQPEMGRNKVILLHDRSDSIPHAEAQILSPENWYGARYYAIIPLITAHSDTLYTLLGWNGNNSLVTQKMIEILSFGKAGEAIFGAAVFKNYPGEERFRVIFRYSAETAMVLKAVKKEIAVRGPWDIQKKRFKTASSLETIILCDRLMPLEPQLEGVYQHYVPVSDVMDGFLPDHGKWLFTKEIDTEKIR